jgi:hypothetical protein
LCVKRKKGIASYGCVNNTTINKEVAW